VGRRIDVPTRLVSARVIEDIVDGGKEAAREGAA
jgi:hypothetical protein